MSTEGRKYFFDLNNFDGAPVPEPEEDLPPPPPLFTEEQLAAEKNISFEEGRVSGRREETQSREQYIAIQISELNTQILSLVLSEQMREKRFEQEVLYLCRTLVMKLFPALISREGYNEIETIIERVILKQPTSKISIEAPKEDVNDLKSYLLSLKDIDPGRLEITGSDDLSKGSCRMKWQDGGAVRDHESLAARIFAELDEVLAPFPQKVQNNESEQTVEPDNGEKNG